MLHTFNRKRRTLLNLFKTLALLKSLSANFAFLADYASQVDLSTIGEIRAFFAPESGSGKIEIRQGEKTTVIHFDIHISEGIHD